MTSVVVITGLLLAVVVLILLSTYNGLTHLRQEVRAAWAQMDESLKKRYDLMPALIATVQAAGGEPATKLPAIITAKNQAAVAFNPQQLASAEIALTEGIHELLAAAERDPALNVSPKFVEIRQKLLASEKAIDKTCRRYNDRVDHLNEMLGSFPTILTAAVIGLKSQPAFVLPIETAA
jgi:LemA protein